MTEPFSFRDIVERANDLIAVIAAAPDGTVELPIVYANPACLSVLNRPPAGLIGVPLTALIAAETPRRAAGKIREAIAAGRPAETTIAVRRGDGSACWLELELTPLRDGQGRAAYFAVIGRDVSDRIEAAQHLAALARTDALTGLANRRAFDEQLRRELGRLRRYGGTAALAMLDLDHFKRINDQHGHVAGDHVLQAVAACAAGQVRDGDLLARYGGEEFALLMPETDLDGARHLAERIRASVAKRTTRVGRLALRVTVSLGVCSLGPQDQSPDTVVARADGALYEAKRAGRNRTFACG